MKISEAVEAKSSEDKSEKKSEANVNKQNNSARPQRYGRDSNSNQRNQNRNRNRRRDDQDSDIIERVVKIRRGSKVVKGGRNLSFNAMVVVGDGN